LNDSLDGLESLVMAEMGELYSQAVIDHAVNPRNVGSMADADAHACVVGPCGDNMEMWLKVRNGRVINATFWTDGCGTTIACGSMAMELTKGKTLGQALAISAEVIVKNLGGLPEDSIHCAGLASSTLKKAVIEYTSLQKEPWRKAYRKN